MTPVEIDPGDTAWVLIAAALVLLMTPGLAFFYGGMVRVKSVLNMLMMSIVTMGIVGVLWVLFGFSTAFGDSIGGVIGNPLQYLGLRSLLDAQFGTVPALAFVGFQAAFAIITVALISGAVADRMKFGAWCLFAASWATLCYFPVAHWVFAFDGFTSPQAQGGWIANQVQALDFAGGTAIHINAGMAALVLVLLLGRRHGFKSRATGRPHNLTLVMLGAALLWFGWFGFNAGSALGANGTAGVAWINTMAGAAAGMCGWLLTERIRDGHPTSLGAASGIVAGLVAITPGCASVSPLFALVIGAVAGVVCAAAVSLKYRFGFDDSLDVVGVHLVGGLVGTLLIGCFADPALVCAGGICDAAGIIYGGGFTQLGRQALAAVAVLAYSGISTFVIGKVLQKTIGLRVAPAAELTGVDISEHAEVGYDLSRVGYSVHRVQHTLVIPPESATNVPEKTNEPVLACASTPSVPPEGEAS